MTEQPQGPATTQTAERRKLATFVGRWLGDDTLHPSPWFPTGGAGKTTYEGRLALGGCFVIGDDAQERPGHGVYRAHKVFGYDPHRGVYTLYLVDSIGQNPAQVAFGPWLDHTVTFEQAMPQGRVRYRYTFDDDRRYTFQMAVAIDGERWAPVIDGVYHKQ